LIIVPASSEDQVKDSRERGHMQGETPTSDGFRVLLADDHGLIRQVIGAMLERYPAVSIVGEAADGLEAISMAAALKPDGIIMDINMPKIDGIEATKQIKAAQPMIRISRTLRH
jgi:DNA-binding NarL/FixJ family response regulator